MRICAVCVLVGAVVLAGCSSSGSESPTSPSSAIFREVRINGTAPAVGQIASFKASYFSETGERDVTSLATWRSSNSAVVLVSLPGRITATGAGEADIVVTFEGVTGTRRLSIEESRVDRITFEFVDGVPASLRTWVVEGARLAQQFYQATLGRNVRGDTRVAFIDQPSPFQYAPEVVTNSATHTITFYRSSFSYQETRAISVMTHELFHVLQAEVNWPGIGSISGYPDLPGVRWLAEGTAEYASLLAMGDRGYYDLRTYLPQRQRTLCARQLPPLRDLTNLDTFYSTPSAYDLAMFSMRSVIGTNLHRLMVYAEATNSMSWQNAFVPAFGMPLDEFYDRSESEQRAICR